MEIVDFSSEEVVQKEVINRNGGKFFADYWGRWLNRHKDEGRNPGVVGQRDDTTNKKAADSSQNGSEAGG
jgi:hypothetical protein